MKPKVAVKKRREGGTSSSSSSRDGNQGRPVVVKVRRWMGPDKKLLFVFLGGPKPPHFGLLKRLEQGSVRVSGLSKTEAEELEKCYGKRYQHALAFNDLSSGGSSVKYVNDALFLDDSVTALKHRLLSTVLGDVVSSTRSSEEAERVFDELYLWVCRSVSPCAERSMEFVRDAFRGRVTINVNELAREVARMKYGFYDRDRHALRSQARLVTSSHALKLVQEEGGLDHLTYPVGYRLFDSSSRNYRLFFDHHPFKTSKYATAPSKDDPMSDPAFPHNVGTDPFHVEYDNHTLLGTYLGRHDYRRVREGSDTREIDYGVPTLNVTTRRDVEAFTRKISSESSPSGISLYFPKSRGVSLGAPEVARFVKDEHASLVAWGHDNEVRPVEIKRSPATSAPSVIGITLVLLRNHARLGSSQFALSSATTVSPSAAAAADLVNLESLFNMFITNTCVPMVKLFDGNANMYKVSRMALHKNVVDAAWVAGNFARRGKSKSASPYLQFVVRVDTSDALASSENTSDGHTGDVVVSSAKTKKGGGLVRGAVKYVKVMLTADGRVDLVCAFPAHEPGSLRDIEACVCATNQYVVRRLNELSSDSYVSFRDIDSNVLCQDDDQVPSDTQVVNLVTSTFLAAPSKSSSSSVPNLASLAAVMNQLTPYYTMIVRLPSLLGDGISATYKRTENPFISEDMRWVVAIRTLNTVFGMNKEQMVPELARAFLVSLDMADQRVSDYQQGRYRALIHVLVSQHYLPHSPTVQLKPFPKGDGFRVLTIQMTNIFHVLRSVDVSRKVIQTAQETPAHKLADFKLITSSSDLPYNQQSTSKANNSNNNSYKQNANANAADEGTFDFDTEVVDDDDFEDAGALESRIEDMLSEEDALSALASDNPSSSSVRDAAAPPPVLENDNRKATQQKKSMPSSGKYNLLDDLKRADPDLFDNRSTHRGPRYATTCGAAPMRQPIVVTAEELERIHRESPNSYEGKAIKYGSTPQLAERNRYICPKVWCPESRLSLTAEQFRARGNKCFREGEQPLVFEHSYWKGNPRYPGLLGSTKHPTGMCMPCCFLKNFDNMHRCDGYDPFSGTNNADAAAAPASSAADIANDFKYIKGNTLPLEHNRYGMVPSALLHAFNGDKIRCGSRDDGSGQFTNRTDCFVRKGVFRSRQSFLQCMASVLNLSGGANEVIRRIVDNLTPDVYIAMNDGLVCRMFMDQSADLMMRDEEDDDHDDGGEQEEQKTNKTMTFSAFTRTFLADRAYISKMGLEHLADALRRLGKREAKLNPEVRREWMIFNSMRRFLSYLVDDGIIKEHKILLGLFNMRSSWLNPEGLNVVVFEQGLHDAAFRRAADSRSANDEQQNGSNAQASGEDATRDMFVDCEGLQRDKSRMRLARPFVFLVKQDVFYEPIHRVRPRTAKKRALVSSSRSGSASSTSVSSVIDENRFMYDTNERVRAVVDAIFEGCGVGRKNHTESSRRLCVSATCIGTFVRRVLRIDLITQVIDFSFRLVGLVTQNSVYVPLLQSEPMLVGESAPPRVMYVSDVHKLRPVFSDATRQPKGANRNVIAKSLVSMFGTLAELTMDDRYAVSRVLSRDAGLELTSGSIVPVDLLHAAEEVPEVRREFGRYMENLNIMIGRKLPDDRTKYVEDMRSRVKSMSQDRSLIARRLDENTLSLREFVFLRSAFNPFPLWYRRQRMRALLEDLRIPESVINDELVDALLFGPNPFRSSVHGRSTETNRKLRNLRSSASAKPDLVISEYDVVSGTWIRRVQSVVINPFSTEEERSIDIRDPSVSRLAIVKTTRESLLKSPISPEVDMACGASSSSMMPRSSSYSSSTSKRRREHRVVGSCGVWQVFHVVSLLLARGGEAIPVPSMRHVVYNALVSDLYRLSLMDPVVKSSKKKSKNSAAGAEHIETFAAMMEDHPTFALHWKNNKRGTDPMRLLPLLAGQLESLTYEAGLYDISVLASMCDVKCDVIMMHDARSKLRAIGYGAVRKRGPQMVDVPGLPTADVTFNGSSQTARYAILLVYRHEGVSPPASSAANSPRLDVVTDHDAVLYEVK